jgi:polyhydroxyalkanoate synthesis regulator phasin
LSIETLNKYLLGRRQESAGQLQEPTVPENYLDMATRAIAAIRRSVLCGEPFLDLFEEVDVIRKDLHVETSRGTVSNCAGRLEEVLTTYQTRRRQAEADRVTDLRNITDMLTETLSHLTTDNKKAEERRSHLEGNISTAARIDEVAALRTYLSKMLHSVREDGKQEKEQAREVMDRIGRQIQEVQKAQSRVNSNLPGRSNALQHLTQTWQASPASPNLHVALFAADSIQPIRQRHGEEVANLILQDLGRKQIQPLAPEGQVFCWSPNSLALIWLHKNSSTAASDISHGLMLPCEQRVFVGTRVAIFNIMLRSLVVKVHESVAETEATLDRFVRRGGGG